MASIRTKIQQIDVQFTATERKIAAAILSDYPYSGMLPIVELSERCGASTASITRFVTKITNSGYQNFQRELIEEMKAAQDSPMDLRLRQAPIDEDDFLAGYARRMSEILRDMPTSISREQFEAVCGLLADPSRNLFLFGGRVSNTLAQFLSVHLWQIRDKVDHLSDNPEYWPRHLLKMRRKDVVILFDFRRYQPSICELAEQIRRKRHATIILVTDKWISPAAAHCDHIVALPIDAGTAWDTMTAVLTFIEAVVVRNSERDWDASRTRIETWDGLRSMRSTGDDTTGNPKEHK